MSIIYIVYKEATIERPERSTGVSLGSACAQGTGRDTSKTRELRDYI